MKLLKFVGLCVLLSAALFGGTISTTTYTNGNQIFATAIPTYSVTGHDMVGIVVTVKFSDNSTQSCTWGSTSSTAGGCTASSYFSISQNNDTDPAANSSDNWVLTNLSTSLSISQLTINAAAGGFMFDMCMSGSTPQLTNSTFSCAFGAEGTPGSNVGYTLDGTTSWGSSGTSEGSATYTNVISIVPNAAVDDIYGEVIITFQSGFTHSNTATFQADTDQVTIPVSGVPEPGTFISLGLGLLLLGGYRLRRRKST